VSTRILFGEYVERISEKSGFLAAKHQVTSWHVNEYAVAFIVVFLYYVSSKWVKNVMLEEMLILAVSKTKLMLFLAYRAKIPR